MLAFPSPKSHSITARFYTSPPVASPDELLQQVQPAHPGSVVQRRAAVMPTPVGIGLGFQEDPDTVKVTIHHGNVEGCLTFNIHQVHLGSLRDQKGHAGGVSRCSCDPQGGAGQTATTPYRLLIDTPGTKGGKGQVICSI